jgi:hypothetical protein
MEDRVDDATIVILLEFEKDGERESANKSPAIGLVNAGIEERGPLNRKKNCLDTAQKLQAESLRLIFSTKGRRRQRPPWPLGERWVAQSFLPED